MGPWESAADISGNACVGEEQGISLGIKSFKLEFMLFAFR